ncbi:MAG: hypothetical protein NC548_27155 [Lachnospiraceae bacterium]|nr:hypothetical protein [Lachnospiraceae bacterium]
MVAIFLIFIIIFFGIMTLFAWSIYAEEDLGSAIALLLLAFLAGIGIIVTNAVASGKQSITEDQAKCQSIEGADYYEDLGCFKDGIKLNFSEEDNNEH